MSGPVTRLGAPMIGLPPIAPPVGAYTIDEHTSYRVAPTPQPWRSPLLFTPNAQSLALVQRGQQRSNMMRALGSYEIESANSYLEHVASHIEEVARTRCDYDHYAGLLATMGMGPSLNELFRFAKATGLDAFFQLPRGNGHLLDRFSHAARGLRSLEYSFGPDHIREVFDAALQSSDTGASVRHLLDRAEGEPLPLLFLNRLTHLLLDRQFEYKLAELMDWEGGRKDAFTGFAPVSQAVSILNQSLLSPLDLGQRREAWMERLMATRACGDLRAPLRMAALLDQEEDQTARRFSRRIVQQYVAIECVSKERMARIILAEKGLAVQPGLGVEAIYVMPKGRQGIPTIYLLDLFQEYPLENPADLALNLVANALHEFVHIELEQAGVPWGDQTVVPIEITAYTVESALRISNGDDRFYRQISSISPLGFLMGLRHFIELDYQRRRPG